MGASRGEKWLSGRGIEVKGHLTPPLLYLVLMVTQRNGLFPRLFLEAKHGFIGMRLCALLGNLLTCHTVWRFEGEK